MDRALPELSYSMRFTSRLAVAASFGLALTGAAFAQGVDSGLEVRVNPPPARGGGVLLYPGGEYSRSVPPLLYPGERSGPIKLHMPGPHRRAIAHAAPAPAKPKRVAKAEPAPQRFLKHSATNEN